MRWWLLTLFLVSMVGFGAGQETQSGPIYKVGGEVTPPHRIFTPNPRYTTDARMKRIRGKVSLIFEVLPDGKTSNIRILESLDPGLDQAAVDAVTHWRFRPATKAGAPVPVEIKTVVDFHLPEGGIQVPFPGQGVYAGLPCAAKINTRDIKDLLKKANQGNAQAQLIIGCACEYGVDRLAPDLLQAIEWYRRAAETLVPAQYFLGETYLSFFDYINAYTWLKIADLDGYKDPNDWLNIVTQLLSKEQLSIAEEKVAAWQKQHGATPGNGAGASEKSKETTQLQD